MLGVFEYIFPNRCVNCTRIIHQKTMPLCLSCYANLSFTHWELNNQNPTYTQLRTYTPIYKATSILGYRHGNVAQKLIMANKYYNQKKIGIFIAELAYPVVSNEKFDVILCIPSHKKTLRQRGYNQVESFSRRLAELLQVDFNPKILCRVKRTDSQTHRNFKERHESLNNAFRVSDEIQKFERVLLLDDVLTTGATLRSCCQAILDQKTVELSVLTMAKVV